LVICTRANGFLSIIQDEQSEEVCLNNVTITITQLDWTKRHCIGDTVSRRELRRRHNISVHQMALFGVISFEGLYNFVTTGQTNKKAINCELRLCYTTHCVKVSIWWRFVCGEEKRAPNRC